MEGYNIDQGEKYSVSSDYSSKAPVFENSSYSQGSSSLPIYRNNEQPNIKKRSRCPRGAILGEIGTCCGLQCTRACALEC